MRIKVITIFLLAGICYMSIGCVATEGDFNTVYARQTRLEAKMARLSQEVQSIQRSGGGGGGSDIELREKVFQLEKQVNDLNRSYSRLEAKVNPGSLGLPTTPVSGFGYVSINL